MPSPYDKMAHLWRRAGFGARPDEINNYLKQGFEATVDQLVYYENLPDPAAPAQPMNGANPVDLTLMTMDDIDAWWLDRMVKTRRPLPERMTLFWHDHFATSVDKIGGNNNGPKYMYWQNQLERQHATGNFRALLKGINRDPAMLIWLDNNLNVKGSPNENYARELFEIFGLGFEAFEAGGYTEQDVQQAARAFTGWRIRRGADNPASGAVNGPLADPALAVEIPPAAPDNSPAAQRHDYTNKTVFGVTMNFNGDDIIDLMLDHEPQRTFAARMLGRKLFEYFAYENPEEHIVAHLAEVAKRTNFDIKALLRDLFLNVKEFYSEKALRSLIKWPVYYAVNAIRLLQAEVALRRFNSNATIGLRAMGQRLFWPPDVFGWPGREEWSTTAQMLARANFANNLASNRSTTVGNRGIPIDQVLLTAGLDANATAEQVADYFISLLIQAPLPGVVRQALIDYLKKADNGQIGNFTLNAATKDKKVRGLIHLLLTRPEAQNF